MRHETRTGARRLKLRIRAVGDKNRLCGLRRFKAYGRVPALHLERGKGLWPQNKKKDLSFGIGEAGVDQTVPPPRRLPCRGNSHARRRHHPIRTRVQEFLSPFLPLSFHWVALL